ncbi:MAG: 2,3,4,5-tetrahydropyridine-2,6-dicarboxylate N-succinyltransferase [Planctomycetes bacterium]|nr:2,3,4,5-tetrahydropyridine-2,6-dicarboxylate N-succinyltransferase [Planctomycetota bacterium]
MSARLQGEALLAALERGEVRAVERDASGAWRVNAWVKEAILAIFKSSPLAEHGVQRDVFPFVDKQAFGVQAFDVERGVRLVPGGSSVRRGAFVARGVVCMPPMYVNVGAFVDEGTMIDSHALVGSCAHVGKRVHLSAAAQLGGVLEPVNARPVIVEDDVFIGGNCGVYEGILIRAGAVLAAGTILTSGTIVYDVVHERELRGTREAPLEIPERAVVVPGSRALGVKPIGDMWANHRGLHVACALIVKYRDEKTDRATALEAALRGG